MQNFFVGWCMRVGFEFNYCANVCRRLLTLPLRRRAPDFLIVGFPKCGAWLEAALERGGAACS